MMNLSGAANPAVPVYYEVIVNPGIKREDSLMSTFFATLKSTIQT